MYLLVILIFYRQCFLFLYYAGISPWIQDLLEGVRATEYAARLLEVVSPHIIGFQVVKHRSTIWLLQLDLQFHIINIVITVYTVAESLTVKRFNECLVIHQGYSTNASSLCSSYEIYDELIKLLLVKIHLHYHASFIKASPVKFCTIHYYQHVCKLCSSCNVSMSGCLICSYTYIPDV